MGEFADSVDEDVSGSPPPFSSHISKISPHSPLIRGDKCSWHRFPEIYYSWVIFTVLFQRCLYLYKGPVFSFYLELRCP
jgi:hypothetical protein